MSCDPQVWLSPRPFERSTWLARSASTGTETNALIPSRGRHCRADAMCRPGNARDQLLGSVPSSVVSWVIWAVWLVMIDWASFLASGFCPIDSSVVAMLTAP